VSPLIEPQPSAEEREAIVAALAARDSQEPGGWAEAALADGVEQDEPDP
jgi:hypothetical protein